MADTYGNDNSLSLNSQFKTKIPQNRFDFAIAKYEGPTVEQLFGI